MYGLYPYVILSVLQPSHWFLAIPTNCMGNKTTVAKPRGNVVQGQCVVQCDSRWTPVVLRIFRPSVSGTRRKDMDAEPMDAEPMEAAEETPNFRVAGTRLPPEPHTLPVYQSARRPSRPPRACSSVAARAAALRPPHA